MKERERTPGEDKKEEEEPDQKGENTKGEGRKPKEDANEVEGGRKQEGENTKEEGRKPRMKLARKKKERVLN